MFVRDATINNYLTPPDYLDGFIAYKQGQAMIKYIADKYGIDKLGEILQRGKVNLTINKALKSSINVSLEELYDEFAKEMKRRYWPEIAKRKEVNEIGLQLTKARKDGSYFNEQPVYTPKGDQLAIFTDKSDYTQIVTISPTDGKMVERLVKAERNADLESLHSYVSGMSFSPDGTKMVFVAKSQGKDALMLLDVKSKDIYKRVRFDFYSIVNPAWSPDGKSIAFSGLNGNKRDIFIYDIASERSL
jgi:WD40 repeat protein